VSKFKKPAGLRGGGGGTKKTQDELIWHHAVLSL